MSSVKGGRLYVLFKVVPIPVGGVFDILLLVIIVTRYRYIRKEKML